MVASNFKSLPLTTTAGRPRTAEVCSARVATRLATLWMSQITFPVILLFPFRKHERSAALRTCNFKVWHRGFSTRGAEDHPSLALRSAGVAFLSTTGLWCESAFSQTLRRKTGSRRLPGPECTPANHSIQTFIRKRCGVISAVQSAAVASLPQPLLASAAFHSARRLLQSARSKSFITN